MHHSESTFIVINTIFLLLIHIPAIYRYIFTSYTHHMSNPQPSSQRILFIIEFFVCLFIYLLCFTPWWSGKQTTEPAAHLLSCWVEQLPLVSTKARKFGRHDQIYSHPLEEKSKLIVFCSPLISFSSINAAQTETMADSHSIISHHGNL